MKPSNTRWKVTPSEYFWRARKTKLLTVIGALSAKSWITNEPPLAILTVALYCFDLSISMGGAEAKVVVPTSAGAAALSETAGEAGFDWLDNTHQTAIRITRINAPAI